jgi:hypothetical protein
MPPRALLACHWRQLFQFEEFDDDPVGITDVARQATADRTGLYFRNSPLGGGADGQQLPPGFLDVVNLQADMRSARKRRLRRSSFDRAFHVLDEFYMVPVTIEMGDHQGSTGDARDVLLPASLTHGNGCRLETQRRPEPYRLVHVGDKKPVVESVIISVPRANS